MVSFVVAEILSSQMYQLFLPYNYFVGQISLNIYMFYVSLIL